MSGMQKFIDSMIENGTSYGLDFLQVLIRIVGYWIAAKLSNLVRRRLDRVEKVNATLKPLFANMV